MAKNNPHPIRASFLLGCSSVTQLPSHEHREIAVFGRSNVGKSTFINRLANHKHLARTSKTPGRTKEINLFQIDLRVSSKREEVVLLADLPGYGFAKVSKKEARNLEGLIESYLDTRYLCRCGCILIDIRRDPREEEKMLQEEFFKKGVPALIIATKCDKLSGNELKKRLAAIAKSLGLESSDILVSGEKIDNAPIWKAILLGTVSYAD